MRSTRFLFAAMPVVMLACVPHAWASNAQQPPAQQQPPQQQAPAPERKFTSSVGMFINVIKADKVQAFETFVKRLHEAIAKPKAECEHLWIEVCAKCRERKP